LKYSAAHARFSARVFWFALLAVLGVGVAISPFRMAAQQPSPATQPAAATQIAGQGGSGEEAKAEKEATDAYRHTPLVTAAAKALHLQVETTARLFEIINFAIIVLALGIPLSRFLPKYIRKRGETLSQNIASARKATEDANARLSAIEAKLAGLGGEIAAIRTQVEQESVGDEARIKAAIGEETARIVASAEQEITAAAAQARRGLRHFAADLAIEQAAKQLVLTPDVDKALIAEFSAELGSPNGTAKGGQN
jgi:F-type H+-transporting ATPase subunit b